VLGKVYFFNGFWFVKDHLGGLCWLLGVGGWVPPIESLSIRGALSTPSPCLQVARLRWLLQALDGGCGVLAVSLKLTRKIRTDCMIAVIIISRIVICALVA
jgi:hypothetical protein